MDYNNIPEGYTQIVKAIECGLKGEIDKMKRYIEMYIEKYPDGVYSKPFKHLVTGNPQNGLMLLDGKQ